MYMHVDPWLWFWNTVIVPHAYCGKACLQASVCKCALSCCSSLCSHFLFWLLLLGWADDRFTTGSETEVGLCFFPPTTVWQKAEFTTVEEEADVGFVFIIFCPVMSPITELQSKAAVCLSKAKIIVLGKFWCPCDWTGLRKPLTYFRDTHQLCLTQIIKVHPKTCLLCPWLCFCDTLMFPLF